MVNQLLADRLAKVRRICQSLLPRLALTTGIGSSESLLLLNDRLWGFRFSIGSFHARWQVDGDEILVFEADRLLQRIAVSDEPSRQAA